MRRILTFSLISVIAVLSAACGGGTPAPDTTAKAENSCEQPAAPPAAGETPTCAGGCEWSGTECRMQRGIKVPQGPDAVPPPDKDKKDKDKPKDTDKPKDK